MDIEQNQEGENKITWNYLLKKVIEGELEELLVFWNAKANGRRELEYEKA